MPSVSQLAHARAASGLTSLCLCALLLVCGPAVARADDEKNPQRGYTLGNSFALGEVETINTTNGNLIFNFPLGRLAAGRGGLSASVNLIYNSKLYDTQVEETLDNSGRMALQNFLSDSEEGGWLLKYWFDFDLVNRFSQGGSCDTPEGRFIWKLYMTFPDGSKHEFRPINFPDHEGFYYVNPAGAFSGCTGGGGTTNTMVYYSIDGTYMRLEFPHSSAQFGWMSGWTLSMPDGSRVVSTDTSRRIYDRNNNFIELQSTSNYRNTGLAATLLADQFGRSVAIQSISSNETQVHVVGFNDQLLTWRVLWKPVFVRRQYRTTGAGGGIGRGGTSTQTLVMTFKVVDRIILPAQAGGQSYVFGYNGKAQSSTEFSHGWGEVSSVVTPSGAQVTYQYELDAGESPLAELPDTRFVLNNSPNAKTLSYQAEYDGAATPVAESWGYNIGESSSCMTAPDNGLTCQWHGSVAFENKMSGLVTRIDNPDGSRVERDWQQNYPIGFNQSYGANPYVKTEFFSVADAAGNLTKTAIKDYNYDKNGNVTRVRVYDWVGFFAVHDAAGVPQWNAPRPAVKSEQVNAYHSPTPDATDATTSSFNAYYNGSAPLLRNALASTEVRAGGLTHSRTEYSYDSVTTTGNVLELRTWDDTRGPLLNLPGGSRLDATNASVVTNQYDQFGNVTLMTEAGRANGSRSQTRYVYGPVGGHTDLYPTEVTSADGTPRARTTRTEYDLWTGLATRTTDVDNDVSNATQYDAFGRPTLAVTAEGKPEESRTVMAYSDVARRVIVRSDLNQVGDGRLVSVQHFDQLGRIRLNRTLEDPAAEDELDEAAGVKVQTRYRFDFANRLSYHLLSRPFRAPTSQAAAAEPTMGWVLTTSDKGARVVRVEAFGGAEPPAPWGANALSTGAVRTAYDADATTITDQADNQKLTVTDALGRLVAVREAPGVPGYDYLTTYSYDALGNQTQVTQGGQTRTFDYSSLSRLVSSSYPEHVNGQGARVASTYAYDPNGSLISRTDPRGVQTTYVYDELNRIRTRSYSDGTPTVTYAYDTTPNGKGRLASVTSSVSAFNYTAYDALGRVKSNSQATGAQVYTMSYDYDRAGHLRSQTYPSGRVVLTEFDGAGRIAGVQHQQTGLYYAGGAAADPAGRIKYAAHGVMSRMKMGNNLWEHTDFNSRLQPVEIGLGASPAGAEKLRLTYGYGPTDRNDGNVRSQTVGGVPGVAAPFVQTYSYDALGRLKSAEETSGALLWRQVYDYDRFGNRTLAAGTTLPHALDGSNNPAVSPASNRITSAGFSYDSAGNLLCDPAHPCAQTPAFAPFYDFNGDGQMKSAGGAAYFYDGDGRRVKKVAGAATTVYVYNVMGQLIAEYSDQPAPSAGTSYVTHDQLGSTRVVTGQDQSVRRRYDYLPFGEELTAGRTPEYTGGNLRQKFTGYERDEETGLDFAQNRHYASQHGRFITTDPSTRSVVPGNPQTWNRYTYTLNNPLLYTDPLGLWTWRVEIEYEIGPDGKPDKTKVAKVKFILVKEAGDDANTLAKQLNIKVKDAQKMLDKLGGGDLRLAEAGNTIGSVFKQVERGLKTRAQNAIDHPNRLGDPNGFDCSKTAWMIGFGANESKLREGTNALDNELAATDDGTPSGQRTNAKSLKSESELKIGDIVRFAVGEKDGATHFANFIFFDNKGAPMVFSKSGSLGPYEVGTAKEIGERWQYGTVRPLPHTNDKTGYYRSVRR